MRGNDAVAGSLFSYIDLEKRVRPDHPLNRCLVSTVFSLTGWVCSCVVTVVCGPLAFLLDVSFRPIL